MPQSESTPQSEPARRSMTVFTHRRPSDTTGALRDLIEAAAAAGVTLRLDEEETRKHSALQPGPGVELNASVAEDVELCVVLGGDGTILKALRLYAGTGVPVFAVNFGEIGFLATVEPSQLHDGIARALSGEFELLRLPGIALGAPDGEAGGHADPPPGINDVAIHRRVGERVAEIAYALEDEIVGSVRCDGLVIATPAGSTGYNLANGGPVMAWGVEGMAVSFIAPHSLTARALIVAPGDTLAIENRSDEEEVDIAIDGRPVMVLTPGGRLEVRFVDAQGLLAQLEGANFYQRLREKFGRLATLP